MVMIGILVELKICIHHLYNICILLMHSILGTIYIYIYFKDVEVIKYFTVRITQTTYLLYKSRIIRLNAMNIEHVDIQK